jgi:hypothetical protein
MVSLGACHQTETVHYTTSVGTTPILPTSADLRLVSERPAPDGSRRTIVCAEPPPDVAKALSTAEKASLAVQTPSSVSGNAAASAASAEQLAQLAGRVPGLLALRDGLFRACEAYANGIIGDSEYALLISRYGEILVTVVLADAASSSSASQLATLTGLNLLQSGSSDDTTTPDASGKSSPTKPATSAAGKKSDAAPVAATVTAADLILPATSPTAPDRGLAALPPGLLHFAKLGGVQLASNDAGIPPRQMAAQPSPVAPGGGEQLPAAAPGGGAAPAETKVDIKLPNGTSLSCSPPAGGTLDCTLVAPPPAAADKPAAGADAAKPAPAEATTTKPTSTSDAKTTTSDNKPTTSAPNTAGAAQAIALMQKSYLALPAIAPILVACISEFDPSRTYSGGSLEYPSDYKEHDPNDPRLPHKAYNKLLQDNCDGFFKVLTDGTRDGYAAANEATVDEARADLATAQAALAAAQQGAAVSAPGGANKKPAGQ